MRISIGGLAAQLALTPLLARPTVRQYMLAGLAEQAHAGAIVFSRSPFSADEIITKTSLENWPRKSARAGHGWTNKKIKPCSGSQIPVIAPPEFNIFASLFL
jgi:hypothetical protein